MYLGCYNDKADRALPLRIYGRLSASQCNAACSSEGKKYSARQYKGECFCGNGNYAKYGSSNKCAPCDSNNVGGYLSCVYEDTFFTPVTTPSSEPTSIPTDSPTKLPVPTTFVPTDSPSISYEPSMVSLG